MKIPVERVNDGFCDCEDGSDEFGTHVCNSGTFVCKSEIGKEGYLLYDNIISRKTKEIHNMLVNDGVCDCCDCS